MGIRSTFAGLAAVVMIGLGAATADAGPIDGSFSIFTYFRPVDGVTGAPVSTDDATGINFLNLDGSDSTGTGQFLVTTADGDFSSLFFSTGTIKDFSFIGAGSAAYPALPIAGFESLLAGGLTFDLQTIQIEDQGNFAVHLTGTGIFNWSSAGFDPTEGTFDFYGASGGGTGASLSFNVGNGTSPSPVPEPGSLLLLASGGFTALAHAWRRRRSGSPRPPQL